jgi:hypothetical protein
MAVGLPLKTTYADGDVYAASDVNDTNGTINITAAPYAAGKNKIINGDFEIWQRGTSFTASNVYMADRWANFFTGTSVTGTYTRETFTPGAAPVAGYEGEYFLQAVVASGSDVNTQNIIIQRIEDVRTLAGQTATVSFWARATSGTPKIGANLRQEFGSGGSGAVNVNGQSATLSTSWARYSFTFSVPSVSGKTIGTSSFLSQNIWFSAGSTQATQSGTVGLQSATFQVWGVQLEAGSVATAFQTATGTIQGELSAAQRYYQKSYGQAVTVPTNATGSGLAMGVTTATTPTGSYLGYVKLPVTMRISPTITIYSYTSSTSGVVSDSGGTDKTANSGVAVNIGDSSYQVFNSSGGTLAIPAGNGFVWHYRAEAEL